MKTTRPLAVVTGASSGIGYEIAKQFAEKGYDLILASGKTDLGQTKADVERLGASVIKCVTTDLSTYEGVEKLYKEIASASQPLDAIAINAGVGVGGNFATDTDLEQELKLIALNVTSTVHLAKRVSKDMVQRRSGNILITASIAGTMPTPFEAVYGASKAFDLSFAQSLRNELAEYNVNVTALLPGATETNFFHRAGMEDTKVGAGKKDDPKTVAKDGVEALLAKRDKVIAGSVKAKLQGYAGEILPDSLTANMHRKQAEPGSATR